MKPDRDAFPPAACDAPWWLHVSCESHWNCCLTAVAIPFRCLVIARPRTCSLQIAGMPSMTNPHTPPSASLIANHFGHTARESEASPRSRQRDITLW